MHIKNDHLQVPDNFTAALIRVRLFIKSVDCLQKPNWLFMPTPRQGVEYESEYESLNTNLAFLSSLLH